ncbi:hypothetical protein GCM10010149_91830 [Nonomuraea roseoviolacea subsp. roseoviolacea]
MTQPSLFGPDSNGPVAKPLGDRVERLKALILVKAAPNPSQSYGETVCVAGLRADLKAFGWLRLYPINFRALDDPNEFKKYDLVEFEARPARNDPRHESWRPLLTSITTVGHVADWRGRAGWVEDYVKESMCDLLEAVRREAPARSLAAIRPREIDDFIVEQHPGWSQEEKAKIQAYVNQLGLFDTSPRRALEAPRFKARYSYWCQSSQCRGHRQGLLDWEFVMHQRNLAGWSDAAAKEELRARWLDKMCGPDRDTILYVGNQAKRQHVFSVLGLMYPPRQAT